MSAPDHIDDVELERRGWENIAHAQRKADANPMNRGLLNNVQTAVSDLANFYASKYPQRVIDAMRSK